MGWIVFWIIFGIYVMIGVKRIPVYFHRVDQFHQDNYPYTYAEKGANKDSAWGAIFLAAVWPFYESGRWLQNYVIKTVTAEQRRQAEYDNAEKIVAEYKKRKAREEREAFERELKGK